MLTNIRKKEPNWNIYLKLEMN